MNNEEIKDEKTWYYKINLDMIKKQQTFKI